MTNYGENPEMAIDILKYKASNAAAKQMFGEEKVQTFYTKRCLRELRGSDNEFLVAH